MIKLYAREYLEQPGSAHFGFGKTLLTNKGIAGKASRFGYKKAKQGIRTGKALGVAGSNRLKNSRTLAKGIGFGKTKLQAVRNRFGG
jgi:hypothetical protein